MATVKNKSKKDKVGEDVVDKPSIWIPSGSTLMDLVVGGGRGEGYEAGMVVNFCAPSGAGKSFACCEIIANARHLYKDKCKWIYDDCESGLTFNTEDLYGFSILPEKPVRSITIQNCFGNIMQFLSGLKDDEFGIYVVDSLDGITSEEIEGQIDARMEAHAKDKEYTKGSYQGEKPKFLSSVFLPKIAEVCHRKNCLVILVSQLRDNIGAGLYAPKDRVSNGRALLFYSDARIWFTSKQTVEVNDRAIGYILHVTTKKMRGPRPGREAMVSLYFSYGIDNVGTNVDFLYDLRTPERGELKKTEAKALDWEGQIVSRDDLIALIEINNLEDKLSAKVRAKWNELETEAEAVVASRKRRFSNGASEQESGD